MRNKYLVRWCGHCFENVKAVAHLDHDYIDCSNCGLIFEFPICDKRILMIVKQQKNQEKKQKHLTDTKSSTSTKAHGNELKRKSISSKINYEVLESYNKKHAKKQHTTSETGECENDELKTIEENRKESEESTTNYVKDHYSDDNANYSNNEDVEL